MKKILALMLAFCLILSLAACGSTETETTTTDPTTKTETKTNTKNNNAKEANRHYAVDKDTVVICTADETPSVTARGHSAVAGGYVNNLTFEALMSSDENVTPQPCLAESYEYTDQPDGTGLWTFHLRKGVKFHNGEEMTAKDVVASLAEAKISPEVVSGTIEWNDQYALDDYTVCLTCNGPSASLLYDISGHGNVIVPASLIESGHDFNVEPIGTGPYVMTNWTISESLTFKAFEDYWGGVPAIKTIIWKIIPEGSARTIALQAHEVDYIIEFDSNDINLVEEDDSVTLKVVQSLNHQWLNLNNEHKPFDNRLVRRAICAAVNKDDLITVATNGTGGKVNAQTTYGLLGNDGTGFDYYDIELAKKYEAESGIDLNGVSFEIICSDDTKRRAAQVIQDNLKEVFGMEAELVSMDLATYFDVTAAGNHDAFIGGYTSSNMVGFLRGLYTTDQIGGSNKTRTADPWIDEMVAKASATIDNDAREEILKEISRYLNDLCPQVPIYQLSAVSAYNKYLGQKDSDELVINAAKRFWVEKWEWK